LLTAALVLGALLAVAAVLFVARPLLREQRGDDALEALAPEERRRLELSEERDRALAALKELEFDHRTGKVSDEDYRTLLRELRRNAADALRALDVGTPRTDVRDRS
jgi:cytochrome c-type biogenesis protein CcmI